MVRWRRRASATARAARGGWPSTSPWDWPADGSASAAVRSRSAAGDGRPVSDAGKMRPVVVGLAAGVFKPLIAGTVRAVTDKTNKTLGFGVFYAMVNVGGSFGPIVMGNLRAISWNYAFIAGAVCITLGSVVE